MQSSMDPFDLKIRKMKEMLHAVAAPRSILSAWINDNMILKDDFVKIKNELLEQKGVDSDFARFLNDLNGNAKYDTEKIKKYFEDKPDLKKYFQEKMGDLEAFHSVLEKKRKESQIKEPVNPMEYQVIHGVKFLSSLLKTQEFQAHLLLELKKRTDDQGFKEKSPADQKKELLETMKEFVSKKINSFPPHSNKHEHFELYRLQDRIDYQLQLLKKQQSEYGRGLTELISENAKHFESKPDVVNANLPETKQVEEANPPVSILNQATTLKAEKMAEDAPKTILVQHNTDTNQPNPTKVTPKEPLPNQEEVNKRLADPTAVLNGVKEILDSNQKTSKKIEAILDFCNATNKACHLSENSESHANLAKKTSCIYEMVELMNALKHSNSKLDDKSIEEKLGKVFEKPFSQPMTDLMKELNKSIDAKEIYNENKKQVGHFSSINRNDFKVKVSVNGEVDGKFKFPREYLFMNDRFNKKGLKKISREKESDYKNVMKQLNTQVHDFITVGLAEAGKGTEKNPIELTLTGEKCYELAVLAVVDLKERAMKEGKEFVMVVPKELQNKAPFNDGATTFRIGSDAQLSDKEKAYFNHFAQQKSNTSKYSAGENALRQHEPLIKCNDKNPSEAWQGVVKSQIEKNEKMFKENFKNDQPEVKKQTQKTRNG
jgi:hypothetical protein